MANKPECVTCLSAWEHLEIFRRIHLNSNSAGQPIPEGTYNLISTGLVKVITAELGRLKGFNCDDCSHGGDRQMTYLRELREAAGRFVRGIND